MPTVEKTPGSEARLPEAPAYSVQDEALRRFRSRPTPPSAPAVDERLRGVEVTAEHIVMHLRDGRTIGVPLSWSWRLMEATEDERQDFEIGEYVVHWPAVDEDLSASGALRGTPAPRPGSASGAPESRAWAPPAIKRLRERLGLTQGRFAEQLGVRQATISDWETGRTEPSPMAARLLSALADTGRMR